VTIYRVPQGLKPIKVSGFLYGLKPVPFTQKPADYRKIDVHKLFLFLKGTGFSPYINPETLMGFSP
jgi:hypothetical protein